MGSFVNMAASRLPLEEDVVVKPSHCRSCGYQLKAFDLIPLFSWVFLHGKCRKCRSYIGIRYFITELVLGICFVLIYKFYGQSYETLILCLAFTASAILIVTDLEHYIIPDSTQIALLLLGFAWFYQSGNYSDSIWGLVVGLSSALVIKFYYLGIRKFDGLGWGDVKFFAVSGVWTGLSGFVPFLFFGGLYGVIMGLFWTRITKGKFFPFGPALCASMLQVAIYPEATIFLMEQFKYFLSKVINVSP